MEVKKCKSCHEVIEGRRDKLYCSDYCKSAFHYQKNLDKTPSIYEHIDKQLKLNRRILQAHNLSGKSTIRAEKLLSTAFDPHYFTHYWKNQRGQVYLFCYDVGFLKLKENGQVKYVIVDWQKKMKPSNTI